MSNGMTDGDLRDVFSSEQLNKFKEKVIEAAKELNPYHSVEDKLKNFDLAENWKPIPNASILQPSALIYNSLLQTPEMLDKTSQKFLEISKELGKDLKFSTSQMTDALKAYTKLPEIEKRLEGVEKTNLKALLTKILAGGILGGGLGAAATEEQGPNESREEKRKRLIRNALLGAGGGAGVGALSEIKMAAAPSPVELLKANAPSQTSSSGLGLNIDLTNPTLLAGLGSAGLAGILTLARKNKKKESLGRRSLNALGNALVAGTLGAGTASLLGSAKQQLTQAVPIADVDPTTKVLESPVTTGLSGTIGAALGTRYLSPKSTQYVRANQDLANFIKGLSNATSEKNELERLLARNDFRQIRAKLNDMFVQGNPINKALNLAVNTGHLHGDEKALSEFLRYQNIPYDYVPSNSLSSLAAKYPKTFGKLDNLINYLETRFPGTFGRLSSAVKTTTPKALGSAAGVAERFIDARPVAGIGGRFGAIRGGLAGAAAGMLLPSLITSVSDKLQRPD